MKMTRCFFIQLFFALSLLLLFSNFVQAETINCTPITSVPIQITTQGIYCLTSDLSTNMTSSNAIEIDTNNVVIDLNGHKLGGLAAGIGTQAVGIYSNSHKNIEIRNGVIRGFLYGIHIVDAASPGTNSGITIASILADANTYAGIDVVGLGSRIHDNFVVTTGGSTAPPTIDVFGILSKGKGSIIRDNVVTGVTQTTGGSAFAIFIDTSSDYSTVDNNRITNPSLLSSSFGVLVNCSDVLVQGNVVFNMEAGFSFQDNTGARRNNAAIHTTYPFLGGFYAGGDIYNN